MLSVLAFEATAKAVNEKKTKCRFGPACWGRLNGKCELFHPQYAKLHCKHGPRCRHFIAGNCAFNHNNDIKKKSIVSLAAIDATNRTTVAATEVKTVKVDKPECPVCFETCDHATNCGHLFCGDCINKLDVCAICNTSVAVRIKLFI